jgi:fluoroquinolone transport system permease protein
MKTFITQLKWQFLLLQKNKIIGISLAVTFIYGLLLYFLKEIGGLDILLVSMVLNDPSVIGFFFVALAIYTEMKHQILPAIFTTPLNIHTYLLSKTISISIIGVICSLGLAMSVKGFDFDILSFAIGAMGICVLSTFLGIFMLTFANEFLKFAMTSIPIFLIFINIPLLQYLGVVDLGFIKYLFPIQGSLDLIDNAISGTEINYFLAYISIIVTIPLFYWLAYKRFSKKIVNQ